HYRRLRNGMHDGPLQGVEKVRRRVRRYRTDSAASHQEAKGMDGVTRVRNKDDVPRRRNRLRDIRKAFLGAERGDALSIGIELHAETALVIGCLCAPQSGNAARG